MVFPTKYDRKYLTPAEEQELFSYIFAGILFEKNVSSEQVRAGRVGRIDARVIQGYEIISVYRSLEDRPPQEHIEFRYDEWLAVRTLDGDTLFVGPTHARALHIRFSSGIGEFSVFAEVSFKGNKYSLDNVLNIPNDWLMDLSASRADRNGAFTRKRLLKIPEWGQRALLIESDVAYVVELHDISDRGSFAREREYGVRTAGGLLQDYLANFPERPPGSWRNPNKQFPPPDHSA